jgi:hypothetical protein
LLRLFSTFVNCVCRSSDIWSGNTKKDYISVVAHYINFDQQLEKRMLDLVLIDVFQYARVEGEPLLLTDEHGAVAQKVLSFLELFYDSIIALSGVYYPTSPLNIHYLVKIVLH